MTSGRPAALVGRSVGPGPGPTFTWAAPTNRPTASERRLQLRRLEHSLFCSDSPSEADTVAGRSLSAAAFAPRKRSGCSLATAPKRLRCISQAHRWSCLSQIYSTLGHTLWDILVLQFLDNIVVSLVLRALLMSAYQQWLPPLQQPPLQ